LIINMEDCYGISENYIVGCGVTICRDNVQIGQIRPLIAKQIGSPIYKKMIVLIFKPGYRET